MEYVLKTNSLCKNYGHFKALNGLSMNVPKGSIYGLIGKNGAGKTTLIRLICGLQEPTSGDYVLYGKKHIDKDITKSRRRMGAIVETPSIYVDLTAYENLKEQYKVLGIPSDDGISEILKLVSLENTGNKKTKNFSLGMRQRLGIAVALAGSPDFLVLDEPVNGLDPQGIIEIRELILKLNQEHGITPKTIQKSVRDLISISKAVAQTESQLEKDPESMSKKELEKLIQKVEKQMKVAAADLNFEQAAQLRDKMIELKKNLAELEKVEL